MFHTSNWNLNWNASRKSDILQNDQFVDWDQLVPKYIAYSEKRLGVCTYVNLDLNTAVCVSFCLCMLDCISVCVIVSVCGGLLNLTNRLSLFSLLTLSNTHTHKHLSLSFPHILLETLTQTLTHTHTHHISLSHTHYTNISHSLSFSLFSKHSFVEESSTFFLSS